MERYCVTFLFNGTKKTQSIQGDEIEIKVDSLRYKLIMDNAIFCWLKDNRINSLSTKITDIEIFDSKNTILLQQDDWSDLNSIK